jgi:hypothetical protein
MTPRTCAAQRRLFAVVIRVMLILLLCAPDWFICAAQVGWSARRQARRTDGSASSLQDRMARQLLK